ncbi:MAG: N-acetylmuramoyl-L-alanine amidase [Phycisphaerae bacterium]|nr:N-acetylmuramoyl-L-alanine amidase [Phycisphaerae bacterium]
MRWVLILCLLAGCAATPGQIERRRGDEIMVCGQLVHTGTPVVLWTDPGGYDAYRVERRFVPYDHSSWSATTRETKDLQSPNRFSTRDADLTPTDLEQVRGGGWTLDLLRKVVDQIVIHYDADGTSRVCFQTLQDGRGLSTHFMIDLDGTVYQTLDVKEKAWHATIVNGRSIGIELANRGAVTTPSLLREWYATDPEGRTRVTIPKKLGDGGERTKNFIGRPVRNGPIGGEIQGQWLVQYDYTPQQYAALIRLTAALCRVLPRIRCDYPRDIAGHLITHKLSDADLAKFHGILGHYHVQTNKVDPGPAFQWDLLIDSVRRL